MSEYALPGLHIELPELAAPPPSFNESSTLASLLDMQKQEYAADAPQGWRSLPANTQNIETSLSAAAILRADASELLLIGMGGSINGARAIYRALEMSGSVQAALEFMDNPDPLSMISTLESIDPESCAVLAVSRSGSTLETVAMLAAALQHIPAGSIGETGAACAVCSLAGDNPLSRLATASGWLHIPFPQDVGGRFSIFGPAGLVPLAFSGLDVRALAAGAAESSETLENQLLADSPAWLLSQMLLAGRNANTVLYTYSDNLQGLGDWWRQLIGESLARRLADGSYSGLMPIIARGPADQHSQNQFYLDGPDSSAYVFLGVDSMGFDLSINRGSSRLPAEFSSLSGLEFSRIMQASRQGSMQALRDSGRFCALLQLERLSEEGLGSFMQFWMYVTACMGIRLGINPYVQPGVERSKLIINALLRQAASD